MNHGRAVPGALAGDPISPLSQHRTREGTCTHAGNAAAPYSLLALGDLGVRVVLQHHLSQGSQSHPGGGTAVSELRAGNGAAEPSLVLPEPTAVTLSPGAPGGPGCPLSPLRPGCPGAPAMPAKPGGPGGPGKPMSPCSNGEKDTAQGNSLLRWERRGHRARDKAGHTFKPGGPSCPGGPRTPTPGAPCVVSESMGTVTPGSTGLAEHLRWGFSPFPP